jgi:hypothetical protein
MTAAEHAGDVAARAQTERVRSAREAATWAFRGLDDPAPPPPPPALRASTGWACPAEHPAVVTLTSRAGRVYGCCTTCYAWERAA